MPRMVNILIGSFIFCAFMGSLLWIAVVILFPILKIRSLI